MLSMHTAQEMHEEHVTLVQRCTALNAAHLQQCSTLLDQDDVDVCTVFSIKVGEQLQRFALHTTTTDETYVDTANEYCTKFAYYIANVLELPVD